MSKSSEPLLTGDALPIGVLDVVEAAKAGNQTRTESALAELMSKDLFPITREYRDISQQMKSLDSIMKDKSIDEVQRQNAAAQWLLLSKTKPGIGSIAKEALSVSASAVQALGRDAASAITRAAEAAGNAVKSAAITIIQVVRTVGSISVGLTLNAAQAVGKAISGMFSKIANAFRRGLLAAGKTIGNAGSKVMQDVANRAQKAQDSFESMAEPARLQQAQDRQAIKREAAAKAQANYEHGPAERIFDKKLTLAPTIARDAAAAARARSEKNAELWQKKKDFKSVASQAAAMGKARMEAAEMGVRRVNISSSATSSDRVEASRKAAEKRAASRSGKER
jgi:hypothetical protein